MKEKYSDIRIPEFYSCLLARHWVEMRNLISKIISVLVGLNHRPVCLSSNGKAMKIVRCIHCKFCGLISGTR
jgi:hypothetical protein